MLNYYLIVFSWLFFACASFNTQDEQTGSVSYERWKEAYTECKANGGVREVYAPPRDIYYCKNSLKGQIKKKVVAK